MADETPIHARPTLLVICSSALLASYGVKLFVELSAQSDTSFGLGAMVIMLGLAAVGAMLARIEAGYGLALAAAAIGVVDLALAALAASHGQSLGPIDNLTGLVAIATLAVAAWTLRRTRTRRPHAE